MTKETAKKRAKVMLPAIKELIVERALADLDKGRETLADELIVEIDKQFPNETPPAWETIIKKISNARNQERNPKDNPWHIGSLREYELNPAVVPILLRQQEIARQEQKQYEASKRHAIRQREPDYWLTITIWQALWASRLYSTIATLLADKPEAIHDSLMFWSGEYTIAEKVSLYAKTDFDTSKLDADLFQDPDVSSEAWSNHLRACKKRPCKSILHQSWYPPRHRYPGQGLLPLVPNIDFARRDKLIKQRDARRAKWFDTEEAKEADKLIKAIKQQEKGV